MDSLSNGEASPQAYKIKKKVDKFKSKEIEKNTKNRNSVNTKASTNEPSQTTQKTEVSNMIKLRIPNKKKKKERFNPLLNKRKPVPEPKFSYKELGIQNPQDFNYETYKKDWCRYCGTRFSGSFTKGPW